ncbi:uncharacterized protein LOC127738311 [Mytilus californianus]|uniref:uncharacterized protein LOC127738311 n=1 Tax=Mytilus californianus TaxID=6549 RepID=UPI0022454609|nr:uncharacterized protein LOC127738311 [Mytilus californianus]
MRQQPNKTKNENKVLTLVIVEVAAERCISSLNEYDSETQLCCDFGVISKFNEHGQKLDCCSGKSFIVDTEICCKNVVFKRLAEDGNELRCCGAFSYKKSEKVCCNNTLHNKTNGINSCCGSSPIDPKGTICCSDGNGNKRSHSIGTHMKCCGVEYYDKTTHYCKNKKKGIVLPKFKSLCNNTEYDKRKQKCCTGTLYNVSDSDEHYKCCGTKLYNTVDEKCCDGSFTIPHDAECCEKGHYHSSSQKCCNGLPVNITSSTEDCCGNGLYDSQYQSCCGSVIYNTSSHQCCKPGGDIIVKSSEYKCCGKTNYDSNVDVCCTKHNFNGETFKIITKSVEYHDTCCVPAHLEKSQSYSSITHRCQLGGIINKTDMCGNDQYNETSDLCCGGVLDKMGLDEGRDCCGIKSYNKTTKICCDNTIYLKTNKQSCHQNTAEFIDEFPPTLPRHIDYGICSYCNLHSIENVILFLESATNLCKRFVLKIANINTSMAGNTTTVDGIILKDLISKKTFKKRKVQFQVPCTCQLNTRPIILLTDLNDYSKILRLGDSNLIIPWSKRASNYLQKKATQCVNDKNKLALDTVAGIKISIEITNHELKRKGVL